MRVRANAAESPPMPPPTTMTSGAVGERVRRGHRLFGAVRARAGRMGRGSVGSDDACSAAAGEVADTVGQPAPRRRGRPSRACRDVDLKADEEVSGSCVKEVPTARSTACTNTSRTRIHGISAAGTSRPWAVRTGAVHCAAEPSMSAARASASSAAPGSQFVRWPGRVLRMSASRCSEEAYIGVSRPVAAHWTRLRSASALAARWATRCARVQPGQRRGLGELRVGESGGRCQTTALFPPGPSAGRPRASGWRLRAGPGCHDGSATTRFSRRPRPSISVTTRSPAER